MHMEGESDFRPWDELAPDVLGLIFKNLLFEEVLEVIPMVCKSWCKVVEGPYCWEKIDIYEWSFKNKNLPMKIDRMLRTLITRSSGLLRELYVSCVDDQMLSFISEHAGSLENLALRGSTISDSMVEQVAPKLSSLTLFDSRQCYKIGTRALEAIGRNCKTLVSLIWVRNRATWMTSSGLSHKHEALAIARTMPKLKYLFLAYLKIKKSVVLDILSGCAELEELDVKWCWGFNRKFFDENYPKIKVVGLGVSVSNVEFSDWDYSDDEYESNMDFL